MEINQILPTFHAGDAIGDEARELQTLFLSHGFKSAIYALETDPGLESEIRPFARLKGDYNRDSITVYHFGLPSEITDIFSGLPGKKVIIYHNITPAVFFHGFSKEMVHIANEGRRQLRILAVCTDLALADSSFNRDELDACGFRRTAVLPLLLDFSRYAEKPTGSLSRMLAQDESDKILFVGRVYPNKKIEDLVKTFYYYKRFVNPAARLIIAGKCGGLPGYFYPLLAMTRELALSSEEVIFTGHVAFPDLLALYRHADLFLSMSEHEGFCVPLLESMYFGLPILAYKAGAMAETLGGGGVLFHRKEPAEIAELAYMLMHDRHLRSSLHAAQKKRLEAFTQEKIEALLWGHLEELL